MPVESSNASLAACRATNSETETHTDDSVGLGLDVHPGGGALRNPCYLVMGVTRVGTVCVVLCSGDEERRVRGTGGACRSGGDRGVEPTDIYLRVQLLRGCFNVVQRSRNRTRI